MKLFVDGKPVQQQFEDLDSLDRYWKQLNQSLHEKNEIIQYIDLNEQRVYEQFEQTIVANFNQIETLKIHTISEIRVLDETLAELQNFTDKMLAAANSIADHFYGDLTREHWQRFSEFSQGLEWMYQALHSIVFLMEKHHVHLNDKAEFQNILKQMEGKVRLLEEAIRVEDHAMIGDAVSFEFVPLLGELKQIFQDRAGVGTE